MSRNMKTSFKMPGTLGIMNLKTGRYFTSLWVVKIKMSENVKFWKKCGEIGLSYLAGHVCVLNRFSPVWLCVTPWTAAHQAPLSMGISQARILEWVAISFSRGSSQAWDWTCVSCTGRRILYQWPTREIHNNLLPCFSVTLLLGIYPRQTFFHNGTWRHAQDYLLQHSVK